MSGQALQELNYIIPVTSPVGYGINNLSAVSEQVIGHNPQRSKLMFFNPSVGDSGITIWLRPGTAPATAGGGSIPLYSGTSIVVEGENVNAAWQAVADSGSGSGQGLTILEFS